MSKKFANESPSYKKLHPEPKSTNPFTEPTVQTHRGLADEGVDQTRIETGPGTKERIAGQKTKVADSDSKFAGPGGRGK